MGMMYLKLDKCRCKESAGDYLPKEELEKIVSETLEAGNFAKNFMKQVFIQNAEKQGDYVIYCPAHDLSYLGEGGRLLSELSSKVDADKPNLTYNALAYLKTDK